MSRSPLSVLVWVDTRGGEALPRVTDELAALDAVTELEVHVEFETPWGELGPALLRHRPDVFHFIGHGTDRGGLLTWDGAGGGNRERSPDEIRTRLSAAPSGGPSGLFLNACHSARWAPTLIPPAGGWVVATRSEVYDDVAAMFAPAFYRHFVVPDSTVEHSLRMGVAELLDEGFDADVMQHSIWTEKSLLPKPGDTAQQINQLLWTVFNRSAFRDSMIRELSFQDLDQALEDVLTALGTGRLFTRDDRSRPFASFDPRLLGDPQVMRFVQQAGRRVQDARLSLRSLQFEFPNTDHVVAGVCGMEPAERRRFVAMLDDVDDKRNAVLREANTYMRRHHQQTFDLIRRSSSTLGGGGY